MSVVFCFSDDSRLFPPENRLEKALSTCLNAIASTYNFSHKIILVNFSSKFKNIHLKWPHVDVKTVLTDPYGTKTDAYIILLNKCTYFQQLDDLRKESGFNPRAKFVIYCEKHFFEIFGPLRKLFIHDVAVIDENLNIYTHFPYTFNTTRSTKMTTCFDLNVDIFPNKIPKIWKNMELKVALVKIHPYVFCPYCKVKGIELEILNLLKSVLGFKVSYYEEYFENWGRKVGGGYDNVFGILMKQKASVGLGMFQMDRSILKDFDMTYPYILDKLVWVVPRIDVQKNINILDRYSGILFVFSYGAVVLIWYKISQLVEEDPHFRNRNKIMINVLRLAVGQNLYRLPKSFYGRVVFFLWLYATWTINVEIQSYLISFLTRESYETQIDSFEELAESDLEIGLYNVRNTNEDWRKAVADLTRGKKVFCNVDAYCLNRTVLFKDMVVVRPLKTIMYEISSTYLDEEGNPRVHVLKNQNVILRYINMCFTKGHPIFPQVEKLLLRIKDSGFVYYWDNWYQNYVNIIHNKNVKKTTNFASKNLNYYHLACVFDILIIGLSIAIVAFLVEILLNKTKLLNKFCVNVKLN